MCQSKILCKLNMIQKKNACKHNTRNIVGYKYNMLQKKVSKFHVSRIYGLTLYQRTKFWTGPN